MGVSNMSPQEAQYLQDVYADQASRERSRGAYGAADFPPVDPPPPVVTPSNTISYSFDGLEQRKLPPSSASLEQDLYDMLTSNAQQGYGAATGYAQDLRDLTLGEMVPEAGGVRSGGYLNDAYNLQTGAAQGAADLQLQGIADLLAAQEAAARGVHGANISGATGRRDLIGGQQDARLARVGGQINDYESMMLGGLGGEETAALDYLTGAENFRRQMSDDSRRESMAGYDRAIAANNQRQVQLANHPDPMVSAAGAETMALLDQSKMMSTSFMDTMSNIDEQIAIDRQLGVRSEFSKARLQLKHDVWNARTRIENDVADTKDAAALQAFDSIAAANASLAAALGNAKVNSVAEINSVNQVLQATKSALDMAKLQGEFAAEGNFLQSVHEANSELQTTLATIAASQQQGRITKAQAREDAAAAETKRIQDLRRKTQQGVVTAKNLGLSEGVGAAWGSLPTELQSLFVKDLIEGTDMIEYDHQMPNGEMVTLNLSPVELLDAEATAADQAMDVAEFEQRQYEFDQGAIDAMDLLGQAITQPGVDFPALSAEIESLYTGFISQGERPPPLDALVAIALGKQEKAAADAVEMQIEQVDAMREEQQKQMSGGNLTPLELRQLLNDEEIPDWVKTRAFLEHQPEQESGGSFIRNLNPLNHRALNPVDWYEDYGVPFLESFVEGALGIARPAGEEFDGRTLIPGAGAEYRQDIPRR